MTHLDSMIQLLLDEGTLVLESDREEPLCITNHDILRMNTATLEDSLSAGTLNWDTTIHGVLYLSIQSALSARCGDILADLDDEKCLRCEEVRIVLKIVEGREGLWATFKLKHCKGAKGVRETQRTIELGQVHDNKFNACCPISLLIIWSLRIGAVKETSWEELISNMRKRPAHVLVWGRPDMPVFCSITPDTTLKLSTPASTDVGKPILRTAAQTTGLLAIPHTYDIRRGSGRELVHLPSLGDDNCDVARKVLGHTRNSLPNGVTDLYIVVSGIDNLEHPTGAEASFAWRYPCTH
ncbi:unnamed protein product [Clonostachys byssicola]|uniref:Uncharacterized protein n=1 Tax=Clonostachys byssicola TaxID=160290 RepID=A0A9N9YAE1_9HYPO|nr:unnamed protein product [Clonostachys byssicola]